MTDKRQKAAKVKCKSDESLTKQSIFVEYSLLQKQHLSFQCWSSFADEHNTFLKSTRTNVKSNKFAFGNIDLRHQYGGISVVESQKFLLAKRPSAAKSEEKRLPFTGYTFHRACRFEISGNDYILLVHTKQFSLKRLIVIVHRCCLLSLYVLQNCDFVKKYAGSSLHVYYAGNLRYALCDSCCSRWYFTFNGAECSSPGTIDGAFYLETGRNHNPHLHRHIEGHCNNIQKGQVRVGFWVGK